MNNRTVGVIGSAVCGASVLCFAVSMIVGIFVNTLFFSCFASMFIALGFMLFICAVSGSNKDNEKRACGNVSLVCAAIYVTLIFLVYFAECTTVNLSPRLDENILSIIDYGHTGSLFFNYDLLGYGTGSPHHKHNRHAHTRRLSSDAANPRHPSLFVTGTKFTFSNVCWLLS